MSIRERSRLDDLFDVLTHRYRRRLLVALLYDPRTALEIPDESTQASEVEFHHVHLPKLEEQGFIEWDRRTRTISPGPAFEGIRPLLGLLDEHSGELPDGWP